MRPGSSFKTSPLHALCEQCLSKDRSYTGQTWPSTMLQEDVHISESSLSQAKTPPTLVIPSTGVFFAVSCKSRRFDVV